MWLGMLAVAAGAVSPALRAPLNAARGPLLAYLAWLAHAAADRPPARCRCGIGVAASRSRSAYAAGGAA